MIPLKKILERKEMEGRNSSISAPDHSAFDQLETIADHGGLMLTSSMIYGSPQTTGSFTYLPLVDMEQDINSP